MSIEDDVALLERVPTLRLLGDDVAAHAGDRLRAAATSRRGDVLFNAGDAADAGYVVQRGSFRVSDDDDGHARIIARPGDLIGELALVMPMPRPSSAVALEYSVGDPDRAAACFSACWKATPPPRAGCATSSPPAPARSPATS